MLLWKLTRLRFGACRVWREMGVAGVLGGSSIVASRELPATADASVEVDEVEVWCLVFVRVCRVGREIGAAGFRTRLSRWA